MGTTTRILALFVLVAACLLAIEGWWSVRLETRRYAAEVEERLRLLADIAATLVERVAAGEGEERAREAVRELDREHADVSIRWLPAAPLPPLLELADASAPPPGATVTARERRSGELAVYRSLSGATRGLLEVRQSLVEPVRMRRAKILSAAVLTAALALVAALLIYPVGRALLGRPLDQLVQLAERVGAGDLTVRAGRLRPGELARLGAAFDAMTAGLARARAQQQRESEERLRAVEQLRHEDRLRTVGKLAAGVAHELGTPLNVVAGRADLIARGRLDEAGVIESAQTIKAQAQHMTEIIRQLLGFARQHPPRKTRLELRSLIDDVVRLLDPMVSKAGAEIVVEAPGDLEIEADPNQLRQVLTNLLDNAVEAMPDGGTVRIVADRFERPHAETGASVRGVRIAVSDEGVGIPEAEVERVFEPFFTTKEVGRGTGLGLSIAHGIVQEHGGWFDVASVAGEGTTFTLYLPETAP